MAEKKSPFWQRLADAMDEAMNEVLGDPKGHLFWSDLSDRELIDVHSYLWAVTQDLQNEWVRRQMLAEDEIGS